MKTVALCYPVDEKHLQWLADATPGCKLLNAGQEGIAEAIHEADIFVGHAKVPVDWDRVVKAGRLNLSSLLRPAWIIVWFLVSLNPTSRSAALQDCLPIRWPSKRWLFCLVSCEVYQPFLSNARSILCPSPHRRFASQANRHRRTGWKRSKAGRSATALSCFDPSRRLLPCSKARWRGIVGGARPTPALASQSDILLLALPLNESTHHLIGRPVFEAMPKGSYLINVARGQVVDEEALIEALRSDHLAGAGLDVAEIEPLPAESPLWTMKNVLLTPMSVLRQLDESTTRPDWLARICEDT